MSIGKLDSEKLWRDRVAAWKASGLSLRDYAARECASPGYREKYRAKLRKVAETGDVGLTFVRLGKDGPAEVINPISVEISVAGGIVMRLALASMSDVAALAAAITRAAEA